MAVHQGCKEQSDQSGSRNCLLDQIANGLPLWAVGIWENTSSPYENYLPSLFATGQPFWSVFDAALFSSILTVSQKLLKQDFLISAFQKLLQDLPFLLSSCMLKPLMLLENFEATVLFRIFSKLGSTNAERYHEAWRARHYSPLFSIWRGFFRVTLRTCDDFIDHDQLGSKWRRAMHNSYL